MQESLTNAARHAPSARTVVTLAYDEDALRLHVQDDGAGAAAAPAADGGGNGLLGMRERASSLGGTLSAGPLPDGGFRVEAELPL